MDSNHDPTPDDPHPLVIFGGSNSHDLAKRIAFFADAAFGSAETKPFPNGESMIKIHSNVRARDVFVVQSLSRRFLPTKDNPFTGVNDNLVELFLWVDALVRASAHRVTAVIPFFGYARQDRKAEGRTPISAKVVTTCLEELGCNRVLTIDLHSEQIQGFFTSKTKLDHLNAGNIVANHFKKLNLSNVTVLSADVGNLKKADKYRQKLPSHYELAVIDKRRNSDGTVEAKTIIGDVKGRTILLLDDIISTAGTMESAIKLALEHGAKEFYIAATHGEFVGKAVERLKHPKIKQICVTDSVPLLHIEGLPIEVLSVAELLGEAIRRIHSGESVSELL